LAAVVEVLAKVLWAKVVSVVEEETVLATVEAGEVVSELQNEV
jgi:hypothetical protein